MQTSSLESLGTQIRHTRKTLRVSSTLAAESAGLSRVTLHRIEKGEPSVSMGAYYKLMQSLGMDLAQAIPVNAKPASTDAYKDWIPAQVRLADYPVLKSLAWHIQGLDTLRPAEALAIYERNARHMDESAMTVSEQHLINALRLGLGAWTADSHVH